MKFIRLIKNILIFLTQLCHGNEEIFTVSASQDATLLLGSATSTAKVVDVPLGATVEVNCHYRNENDHLKPKLWSYKQKGSTNPAKEIIIGKKYNLNKVSVTANHTLIIRDFHTDYDSGVYSCKFPSDGDRFIFTYVIEGVYNTTKLPYVGSAKHWQEYKQRVLIPINEKFDNSKRNPFAAFRNTFRFTFRVKSSWESWGPCKGSTPTSGVRKKIGKCRLRVIPVNKKKECSSERIEQINQYYLRENYDVPCLSIKLDETLPEISKIVRNIPGYEMTENCVIEPVVSSETVSEYKFKCKKQIVENSNCILVCSDAAPESKVKWYKDDKLLNSTYRNNMGSSLEEPHLTIDSYNSLYIIHVTKKEEGVYSCTVDDKKIQMYEIKIVAKCRLLNDDFFRYSIYLGFVLSLTITCYCAGICVAWHGKTNFADPLNLNNKRKHYRKMNSQQE